MQIRIATLLDIPLINELAQKVWRVYYKDIISEEQIEYMLEKMYSSAALHNQMQIEKHCFLGGFNELGKIVVNCSNLFIHKELKASMILISI